VWHSLDILAPNTGRVVDPVSAVVRICHHEHGDQKTTCLITAVSMPLEWAAWVHELLVKLYKGLGVRLGTFPDDMDG
jgi:hypothetical protein